MRSPTPPHAHMHMQGGREREREMEEGRDLLLMCVELGFKQGTYYANSVY